MSNETKKLDVFSIFKKVQVSYEAAKELTKSEQGAARVERFRIPDGKTEVRVLPLAPIIGSDGMPEPLERESFEYPLHQLFLNIQSPGKNGKKGKTITVPVIDAARDAHKSVDLINTYVNLVKEYYSDDEELVEKVGKNSYEKGLRWNYVHVMYVYNLKERDKGAQQLTLSHAQYKSLRDALQEVWDSLREDGGEHQCPVSSFDEAYPVIITKKDNNGKIEYNFSLKVVAGTEKTALTEDELDKLLDLPRIPDEIYRYTRYQAEATVEFLKQYDERNEIDICGTDEFKAAVDKLLNELSKDDTSHFSFSGSSSNSNSKESAGEEVDVNSLYAELDNIEQAGLSSKSKEYLDLREKIRQYIEDNNLDILFSHSKSNADILEEIEEAMQDRAANVKKQKDEAVAEEEEEKKPKKRAKRAVEEDDEEEADEEQEEKPAPRKKRAARPSDDDDDNETEEEEAPKKRPSRKPVEEEPEQEPEEEEAEEEAEDEKPAPKPRHRTRPRPEEDEEEEEEAEEEQEEKPKASRRR